MHEKAVNDIIQLIQTFNESLKAFLPALENEVNELIENKCNHTNIVENHLDALLSLTTHGIANDLFIRLLEYYKTVDAEGGLFYWNEYDSQR